MQGMQQQRNTEIKSTIFILPMGEEMQNDSPVQTAFTVILLVAVLVPFAVAAVKSEEDRLEQLMDHILAQYLQPNNIHSWQQLTPEEIVIWLGYAMGRQQIHADSSETRHIFYEYDDYIQSRVRRFGTIIAYREGKEAEQLTERFLKLYRHSFLGDADDQIQAAFVVPDRVPSILSSQMPDRLYEDGYLEAKSLDRRRTSVIGLSYIRTGGYYKSDSSSLKFRFWEPTPEGIRFYDDQGEETIHFTYHSERRLRGTIINPEYQTGETWELKRADNQPFHMEGVSAAESEKIVTLIAEKSVIVTMGAETERTANPGATIPADKVDKDYIHDQVKQLIQAVARHDAAYLESKLWGEARELYLERVRAVMADDNNLSSELQTLDYAMDFMTTSIDVGSVDLESRQVEVSITASFGVLGSYGGNRVLLQFVENEWKVSSIAIDEEISSVVSFFPNFD